MAAGQQGSSWSLDRPDKPRRALKDKGRASEETGSPARPAHRGKQHASMPDAHHHLFCTPSPASHTGILTGLLSCTYFSRYRHMHTSVLRLPASPPDRLQTADVLESCKICGHLAFPQCGIIALLRPVKLTIIIRVELTFSIPGL